MTALICKYIEIYGGELAIRERSRSSTLIMARLILPNGTTISGGGITVTAAIQTLNSLLEAEYSK